jgi:hypothetical protein
MKKGIIITLPRHDDVTEYLAQFSKQIENLAIDKNIDLKKLDGKEATQKEFEKVINKLDYKMIVFNGHGNPVSIFGHRDETLIENGLNEFLLYERIVYARSCNSAAILGKECTKNTKEGCFIGYDKPFQFYVDIQWMSNPLKDNTARLFLEPSNLVPISMIKGNSSFDANENSKKQILKNINKVLRNPDSESFKIAEALWNNYEGQVLHGNPEASF